MSKQTPQTLRDGLAMIDAIASDRRDDAAAIVRRMHEVAIETLRRARVTGIDERDGQAAH